jgi:hypothetical protein|tara:strand:- start:3 stop:287 length:285 start_codon:yes stop_codon:yes gene_type:complete
MITDLRSYKFITYILTAILIIPFAILYILIFAGLLILIGFATGFLLGPRGIGFLLLSIWGGYRTAKHLLSNRWLEIKRREYDKVKKEEKPITKE